MKKIPLYVLAIIGVTLYSCTDGKTNQNVIASSITGTAHKSRISETDLRFLVKSYSIGLFKMSVAAEGEVRSISTEAVQLASTVNKFYTIQNSRIEALAFNHGFDLPLDLTDEQKQVWKNLVKEKGWCFDEKFLSLTDEISKEEAGIYGQELSNTTDNSIKELTQDAIAQLQLNDVLKEDLALKISERNKELVAEVSTVEPKSKTKSSRSSLKNLIAAK